MGRPVRFGVVGSGHWARTVHLPALGSLEGARLTALHARDPARCRELATAFKLEPCADFAQFLQQVDVVCFAVPPSVQAPLALQAALAGKKLLLEKPLATSLPAAATLCRAIDDHQVATALFLTRLYSPPTLQLVERARAMGITRFEGSYRSGALVPGSPYADSAWRLSREGALLDMAPHLLSLAVALLGPAHRIAAHERGTARFELQCRHAAGGSSSLFIDIRDTTLPPGVDAEHYACESNGGRFSIGPVRHDSVAALQAAARCLLHGHRFSPAPDAHFGRELVAMVDAALRSLDTGKEEPVTQS